MQRWKGLAGVGGLLLELALFSTLAGGAKHVMATGVAMLGIAAALTVLTGVLFIMGKTADTMGSGLLVMAGLLIELAAAMYFMQGSIVGAFAMLVCAAAIAVLTPALIALGVAMNGDAIVNALITLAGGLVILGVAAAGFAAAGPAILLGAAALAAFSAAVLLAGVAIAAFGVGLAVFTAGLVAAGSTVVAGVGVMGQALSLAVTLLIQAIENMLQQAVMLIPFVVELGLMVIEGFLQGVANHLPNIIQSGAAIILAVLVGINQYVPQILQAGIDLMITFIDGMANGIRDNTDKILAALGNLVSAMIELVLTGLQNIVKNIPGIGDDLNNMLEDLKTGVRDTLAPEDFEEIADKAADTMSQEFESATGEVRDIGEKSGTNFGEGLGEQTDSVEEGAKKLTDTMNTSLGGDDVISMLSDAGGADIQGWLDGAGLKTGDIETTMKGLAGTATDNLGNSDGKYTDAGSNATLGFIQGMGSHDSEVSSEARRIANVALSSMQTSLAERSPSKKTYKIGVNAGKGFIIGLENTEKGAKKAAKSVGYASTEALKDAVDAQVGILDYAGKAVEEFASKWSATQEWGSEEDGIIFATDALEALALQDVKAEFLKTRDEFKKNLDGQIDMFKMFDFGNTVRSDEMVRRFESNLQAMTQFSDYLEQLAQRGIDKGLLQNLAKRGPSALGEIKAFIKASDEEFTKLNEDWVRQGEILDEVSDKYMSTLAYAMAGGEEAFTHVLDPETGEDTGKTFLEATLAGMRESLGLNLQEFEAVGEIAAKAVSDGLGEATSSSSKTTKKTQKATTSMTNTVTETVDSNIKKEDGIAAGYRLCEGIAEGIRNGIEIATTAAEELALKVVESVNNALGIASPSKVFAQIGYYSDEGLANGFTKYGTIVREAAAESALGAVDEISGVFGRIGDMVDGLINLDPTIRPVLDLTNLQNAASGINSLLGLNDPYALYATANLSGLRGYDDTLANLGDSIRTAFDEMKDSRDLPPVTINIYPTENQNPNDIAEAVSWKLNHDVLKRRAVYGGA